MHQTNNGIVHSVCTLAASVSDVHVLPDLMHGKPHQVARTRQGGVDLPHLEARLLAHSGALSQFEENHEWLLTAFALVNLYQHRKRLVP